MSEPGVSPDFLFPWSPTVTTLTQCSILIRWRRYGLFVHFTREIDGPDPSFVTVGTLTLYSSRIELRPLINTRPVPENIDPDSVLYPRPMVMVPTFQYG